MGYLWAAYLRAFISQGLQDLAAAHPTIQHCSFHTPETSAASPNLRALGMLPMGAQKEDVTSLSAWP